jgi:CelD/BcsL family acetyltransferase involved in cellulose biosynthesis
LVNAIVDESRSWKRPWRLMVEQLAAGDTVAREVAAALDCADVLPGDPCPVLRLEKGPEPEAYESKSMRKQVRQARNRLETDGRELAIDRRTEPAAVEATLDELEALHRGRDHALGRKSALDDERGRAFWREITLDHADRGEVEVVRMTVDGSLAAYDIAFLDPPRYTVWDHRIDVEFGRYFPGHLLARSQLDGVASREEITTLDHGRGDEPYKQLMSDDKEAYEELAAWSSPTARVVLEAPHRTRRRMATFADRHQPIRRAWVWIKQKTVAR